MCFWIGLINFQIQVENILEQQCHLCQVLSWRCTVRGFEGQQKCSEEQSRPVRAENWNQKHHFLSVDRSEAVNAAPLDLDVYLQGYSPRSSFKLRVNQDWQKIPSARVTALSSSNRDHNHGSAREPEAGPHLLGEGFCVQQCGRRPFF